MAQPAPHKNLTIIVTVGVTLLTVLVWFLFFRVKPGTPPSPSTSKRTNLASPQSSPSYPISTPPPPPSIASFLQQNSSGPVAPLFSSQSGPVTAMAGTSSFTSTGPDAPNRYEFQSMGPKYSVTMGSCSVEAVGSPMLNSVAPF